MSNLTSEQGRIAELEEALRGLAEYTATMAQKTKAYMDAAEARIAELERDLEAATRPRQ